MSERVIIKAGTLVMVDAGEYSDYGLEGFYVALAAFDPIAMRDEMIAQSKGDDWHYSGRNEYLAFLTAKGLLMEIRPAQIYVGSYGVDDMRVWEMADL
jgi:hypothetical protein